MIFEELKVLKMSAHLNESIYKKVKESDTNGYMNQLLQSGLSIVTNIAECLEKKFSSESPMLLYRARSSCNRLQNYIILVTNTGLIDEKLGRQWLMETNEISALITNLINAQTVQRSYHP